MESFVIAKLLVVDGQGKVLTLRRGKGAPRRAGEWDFPGGFVDENANEDLTAAALRETREEAGIDLPWAKLVFAMSERDSDRRRSGTWVTFVAHVQGEPDVALSFEHDAFTWLPPKELLQAITYDRQLTMLRYVIDNKLLER